MPDSVTSRSSAATQRPAASLRNSVAGQPLKTKSEKRAEAKAAKARARAREKRRQTLTVAGAALVVLALVVGLIAWISNTSDSSTPAAEAPAVASAEALAPTDAATTEPAAAFPPVPDGADPALSKKPAATAGSGELSKLTTKTLIEGKGAAVESGQTINVNYVGVTYADGKEFDSSWSRSEAFSFQIGSGGVIQGWDQGLIGAKVGSRVQLDIPADLAYGDNPTGGQPAGALRFIVDVLSAS
ncbi:FKBP-type peptidyl-prolyl cis-trans isomerase [Actinoplanes sp. CA-015351]|uniref:FKBP-type peptidyl-prolyl cis-trans isomerase n=1 Tax=Actinoplanes sp. CA-015351 TaxID=3239897 RepID=UPI003D982378